MRWPRGKTIYALAISLAVLAAALLLTRGNPLFLAPIRNLIFDTYQRIEPRQAAESAVAIIDIDEASIRAIGQWPWPRTEMARLVDTLSAAGVLAIGFDIVFSEPDRTSPEFLAATLRGQGAPEEAIVALRRLPSHDGVFAEAIAGAPVALGFFDSRGDSGHAAAKKAGISWLGADLAGKLHRLSGTIASLPRLQQSARGSGTISLGGAELDDVVRQVPLFVGDSAGENAVYPALALESLRLALESATGDRHSFLLKTTLSGTEASGGQAAITEGRIGSFIFPLTADGALTLYYAPEEPARLVSAASVLTSDPAALTARLEGKIALVGASAVGLRDIRTTTLRERVPGVAIHAQIIDQIMEGAFLSRPDWAPGLEWVLTALVALTMVVVLPLIGPVAAAVFGAFCVIVIAGISWFAFARYGMLIDPAVPVAMGLLSYLLTTILLYAFTEREKRFIRSAFQHYLAPELINRLEAAPERLKLGGEIRDMTLMFIDVRDFTAISEHLAPEEVVAFLNDLLSPLSDIIQAHEGAIDKYIGDSIMAFWNAPLDVAGHPEKACRAALAILAEVDRLNAADTFGFRQRGLRKVAIGIGINSGEACVGNMGSLSRFDYSVVGDTVNVAARLETASKSIGWPILVSHMTRVAADTLAFLPAGELPLKGKTVPQPVYALIGDESYARSGDFINLREAHQTLLDALVAGDFDAITAAHAALARQSGPRLSPFFDKLLAEARP